jgi:hypothetical protein
MATCKENALITRPRLSQQSPRNGRKSCLFKKGSEVVMQLVEDTVRMRE